MHNTEEDGCRNRGAEGVITPQILTDQLTLSQPRGAEYAHQIVLASPYFQTFRRPCKIADEISSAKKLQISDFFCENTSPCAGAGAGSGAGAGAGSTISSVLGGSSSA